MIHADFWNGRIGPYLSPAVVVEADPPAEVVVPASPVVGTKFEDTADTVVAVEAVVLGELAELTARFGAWEAARLRFAGDGPDGTGSARGSGAPVAVSGAGSVHR